MSAAGTDPEDATEFDRDVVVVGGGPAGCSAAVFVARYGLDAVVFDRGSASLRRCAHLENYLGFPGGVEVETFYRLAHAHAEAAGCDVVSEMVEAVERAGDGFAVDTRAGRTVTAGRVVAATRYGADYLRPLDDGAMFEVREHDGEAHERFDRAYADDDGRTPVDGLYVASPAGERDVQAIVAAGRGAHVARTLLADHRRERGYPGGLAREYDWLRRAAELDEEWRDRERWREHFDERVPDDHDLEPSRLDALREAEVDRLLETYLPAEDAAARADAGVRRLVEAVGPDRVLDALDDDHVREYVAAREPPTAEND